MTTSERAGVRVIRGINPYEPPFVRDVIEQVARTAAEHDLKLCRALVEGRMRSSRQPPRTDTGGEAVSEMIERVALGIWRAREKAWPKQTQRMTPDDLDRSSGAWQLVLNDARAAIEAMREPSEAMVDSGTSFGRVNGPIDPLPAWRAMIDVALAPVPERKE